MVGTPGIVRSHSENNEGSLYLSGAAVLTAPLHFRLAPAVPSHAGHVNRLAHSRGKHAAEGRTATNHAHGEAQRLCLSLSVRVRARKNREAVHVAISTS